MMKRSALHRAVISLCLTLPLLVACGHEHVWKEATCTEPATCEECGETQGEPLGHEWEDATCKTPKTCSVCGATEGEKLGHDWIPATHESPKTCARCGKTSGEPLMYDVPAGLTEGYEFGNFGTYNSPAEENGLGDTMVWFDGSFDTVNTVDLPDVKAGLQIYVATVTDEDGHNWLVELDCNEYEPIDKYTALEGHKLCILGQYQGFSGVYQMPAVMMEKIFDQTTGNMISSAWFVEAH